MRHLKTRRLCLFAIIFVAFSAYSITSKAQNGSRNLLLPWPADLHALSQEAQRRGEPLVLMVSLPGCPWCELLRRNYLTPMRNEGLAAYEFMINERTQPFADFKGQRITPADWSEAAKVKFTPTLLFFNAKGQEIAPRIEGVASADFIGAVIQERLATAREAVKALR